MNKEIADDLQEKRKSKSNATIGQTRPIKVLYPNRKLICQLTSFDQISVKVLRLLPVKHTAIQV